MEHVGTVFRALHEAPETFVIPNPWDIGTAKLLAALGFKALATTSAGFAFSRGLPDGGVGFEAAIAHCREIVAATHAAGLGRPRKRQGRQPRQRRRDDLRRRGGRARRLLHRGCDRRPGRIRSTSFRWPSSASPRRPRPRVRSKHDFVFTARAENFLWGRRDLDDTIRRLQAFEKAGADVLYAPGLADIETVRTVCAAVSKPVNVLAVRGFTVAALHEAGVRRVSLGSKLTTAAFGAVRRAATGDPGARQLRIRARRDAVRANCRSCFRAGRP